MPATKAPSSIDRPARSVSQANSSVASSTFSVKTSCERSRATCRNQRRISGGPNFNSRNSSTVALTIAQPSSSRQSPGPPPSAGVRISSGISARSWNSRMPKTRLPWSVSSSRLSASILLTSAVDDIATAPPITIAPRQSMPPGNTSPIHCAGSKRAASTTAPIVAPTWAGPRPNT